MPLWEVGGSVAAAEEAAELVDFGGKPGQGEVFGDVIEGEKATEKDEGAWGPAVSDVRDPEGAVEGASVAAAVRTRRPPGTPEAWAAIGFSCRVPGSLSPTTRYGSASV